MNGWVTGPRFTWSGIAWVATAAFQWGCQVGAGTLDSDVHLRSYLICHLLPQICHLLPIICHLLLLFCHLLSPLSSSFSCSPSLCLVDLSRSRSLSFAVSVSLSLSLTRPSLLSSSICTPHCGHMRSNNLTWSTSPGETALRSHA